MKDVSLILARFLLLATKRKDNDAIERWKNRSKENASFADLLNEFWHLPMEEKPAGGIDTARERLISRINASQMSQRHRTIAFYLTRVAAVFILLVSIAGSSVYIASKIGIFHQNNWVQVSTEAGQKSKITLPDGTVVWLNAESTLAYQQSPDERTVKLTGEAYFEVVNSTNHPFIVNAGDAKVKVFGTKFNVSHYSSSKITEAALLEGKISMTVNKIAKEVVLKPGEKVIYNSGEQVLVKLESKVQNEISWKQGILYFENTPFNEMIKELERFYGVKFSYESVAFDRIHYSGSIDNLEIYRVLEFINLTIPINYEVNNKTIELRLK